MKAIKTRQAPLRAIDWQHVHRRLEAVREVVDRGWTPTPEQRKQVLRARAQALARPIEDTAAALQTIEIVEFLLAQESYGIESSFVREVYPLTDLTPLPCSPPFVLGIVNVRGEIVSVIDIKKFFDLPEKGLTDLNKVIILHSDNMLFGVLADSIIGVRKLPISDIQPPLPTMTGLREDYLSGLTRDGVAVLDAAKLLSDSRIVVHETVQA